jgi:hypothetical protein
VSAASVLAVLVDGVPMPEAEGRAFWGRFSAYMEEHRGDLAGFAKQEGFASVHPAMEGGRAVLLASRSAPQKAYASVEKKGGGGSSGHQGAPRDPPRRGSGSGKPTKRRR